MRSGIRDVRTEVTGTRAELKADIADSRAEFRAGFLEVHRELAEMRSDLTRVAVGRRGRAAGGRPVGLLVRTRPTGPSR